MWNEYLLISPFPKSCALLYGLSCTDLKSEIVYWHFEYSTFFSYLNLPE